MENMGISLLEPVTNKSGFYFAETESYFDSEIEIRESFQGLQFYIIIDTNTQQFTQLKYNGVEYIDDQNICNLNYAINGILTAAISRIILYEHFFHLHKFVAEAHTLASEFTLDSKCPLFRMLHPHTYNVLQQNINASYALFDSQLGSADGMLSNFLAITPDSYALIMKKSYEKYKGNHFSKSICNIRGSNLSSDSKLYLITFQKYVHSWIQTIYPNDIHSYPECVKFYNVLINLVPNIPQKLTTKSFEDTLVNFLFGSSVYHEIIGTTLIPHYIHPFRISSALTTSSKRRIHNHPYSSQAILSNIAVVATGLHSISLKMPLESQMFSEMATLDQPQLTQLKNIHHEIWDDFHKNNDIITEANHHRPYKQNIVNINSLEYSIAT